MGKVRPKPAILVIMDGWGVGEHTETNAAYMAQTPTIDTAFRDNPATTLLAHGEDVGLPPGQMGNSEVGHMNIGAGRIVEMDLPRLNRVFEEGSCTHYSEIGNFIDAAKKNDGDVHLFGLLSTGGVHGHQNHMVEMANALASEGQQVWLHLITDGRDVAPKSALTYLELLEGKLINASVRVATVSGRYYAMDRNGNWERIARAYQTMCGHGSAVISARDAIENSYKDGVTDEFILPVHITGFDGINDGETLLFMNYRADRVRQITTAFGDPSFDEFDFSERLKLGLLVGIVKYSDQHDAFMDVLFPEPELENTLGACVSAVGLRQVRIAETEKYAHVTFFLNGGNDDPFDGEDRRLVASPDVATYDLKPEMSAAEVTDRVCEAIHSTDYDLIVVNLANPDMVGHSGDLAATIAACEAVDQAVTRILSSADEFGCSVLLTADHGNCEVMRDPKTGAPFTAHTINPVPICLLNGPEGIDLRPNGRLADIAPTILDLLKVKKPNDMTGLSLMVQQGLVG